MTKVVGHRGIPSLEPENTLRSIRRAIDLGVDRVEIDIRFTKDRELAVIHDQKVDRTTNGHGFVKDFTLEEIRELDAGKGERIPTLKEVLDLTLNKVVLEIELKEPDLADPVVRTVEETGAGRGVFVIASFLPEELERVRKLNSDLETGLIMKEVRNGSWRKGVDIGACAIHIHRHYVTPDVVRSAHEEGLKINAWIIDTVEEMQKMTSLGVDSICTNCADVALRFLGRLRSA